jgi:hypothetical protein
MMPGKVTINDNGTDRKRDGRGGRSSGSRVSATISVDFRIMPSSIQIRTERSPAGPQKHFFDIYDHPRSFFDLTGWSHHSVYYENLEQKTKGLIR